VQSHFVVNKLRRWVRIANPPPPDRGRWQVFPLTLFSALIAEERKVSVTI